MRAKKAKVLSAVLVAAISLSGANVAAKKEAVSCEGINKGVGYFAYFQKAIPIASNLDEKSASHMGLIYNAAVKEIMTDSFEASFNLHEEPFSLKDEEVVKTKMGGAAFSTDDKKMGQAAAKQDLGYFMVIFFYTTAFGPKEGKTIWNASMEELPSVELADEDRKFHAFPFISIQCYLLDSAKSKIIAKAKKETISSYREWFMKKYPEYFSGEATELPPGVDYNSSAQYQLFIKDTLLTNMETVPEIKVLRACKENKQ